MIVTSEKLRIFTAKTPRTPRKTLVSQEKTKNTRTSKNTFSDVTNSFSVRPNHARILLRSTQLICEYAKNKNAPPPNGEGAFC
jgi:hypothetical protein